MARKPEMAGFSPVSENSEQSSMIDEQEAALRRMVEQDEAQEAIGENQPEKPKKKKEKKKTGEPELAPELLPYKKMMEEWLAGNLDKIGSFLAHRGVNFKIICGDGFYHQPGEEGGPDTICLSVPFFKEHMEAGDMSIEQIFFGSLHEIAHLKTMLEMDMAGKKNQIQQFSYENSKIIRDKGNPEQFAKLRPAYRQFYNIMEDMVVNRLVLRTTHFSERVSEHTRRAHQEITDLYTEKFFALYQRVAPGEGDFVENPDPKAEKHFLPAPAGTGDFRLLTQADYEAGFDWDQVVSAGGQPLGRSGQFITYFVKQHMIGLKTADVFDPQNNPDGKAKLDEDATFALTQPLAAVYSMLLQKIKDKYAQDPAQLKRYLEFMSQTVEVELFKADEFGRAEKTPAGFDQISNVFARHCLIYDADKKPIGFKSNAAELEYKEELRKRAGKVGFKGYGAYLELTFSDFFAKYLETVSLNSSVLSLTLNERTIQTRHILEPIYTMLCILDDNFDVVLPETKPGGDDDDDGEGGEGGGDDQEKPEWRAGEKVRNARKGSPNFGRKGIITHVEKKEGKIIFVEVEYFAEEKNQAMSGINYSGETDKFFYPDEDLELLAEDDEGQGGKGKEDKRKREKKEKPPKKGDGQGGEEDQEDETEDDDKNEDEDENDDEDENQKKGKPKKNAKPKPKQDGEPSDPEENEDENEGEPKNEKDIKAGMDRQAKALKKMLEQDERAANLKELAAAKKGQEYQKRKNRHESDKALLEQIRQRRKEQRQQSSEIQAADEASLEKFRAMEDLLKPFADEMAESWREVVDNIAQKIEVIKEKYFRRGKVDIKKLQRYFPEIEAGMEMDDRLVYEQWVEKIQMDIRPKMVRLLLLIDNSGSMTENIGGAAAVTKIDAAKMCLMLLNKSLNSLRVRLRDEMVKILGEQFYNMADLVCDIEVIKFGERHQVIKPFDFEAEDLQFLDEENVTKPEIDIDRQNVETVMAMTALDAHEGSTHDLSAWREVVATHDEEKLIRLIRENRLTEVIIQASDGHIGEPEEAREQIRILKDLTGLESFGLAIGEEAVAALQARHDFVIPANTPQEIVARFGELLRKVITERVEKPIEDFLEEESQRLAGFLD